MAGGALARLGALFDAKARTGLTPSTDLTRSAGRFCGAAARLSPIPEHRLHQREGGDRGGIRAEQPQPERDAHRTRALEELPTSLVVAAPLQGHNDLERHGQALVRHTSLP